MTSLIQDPFLWILLVVLIAAGAAVLRARTTNMALRGQIAATQSGHEAQLVELHRLGAENMGLRTRHEGELASVRKDAEEDTKAVLKAAMQALQVLAEQQRIVIDKVQKKYGDDPQILADLMTIDHTNSQFGRRAQGISVLCGGWLGRRESKVSVYDVARSAQGRIRHFDRVQINTQVNPAIASRAVEPVALVLAELLANATNYTSPDTPVEINIRATGNGVCVIVDDAGLGMSHEEKDRAAQLLAPPAPVGITSLGTPPRFGFVVAGMLADRYGFNVSVDSVSPYGGVRAVILLPEALLTTDAPEPTVGATADHAAPQRAAAEVTAPSPTRLAPVTTTHAPIELNGTTVGGLPKRRRRVAVVPEPTQETGHSNEPTSGPTSESQDNSETRASRLGAFQRGTQSGRNTLTSEGPQDL